MLDKERFAHSSFLNKIACGEWLNADEWVTMTDQEKEHLYDWLTKQCKDLEIEQDNEERDSYRLDRHSTILRRQFC